jgi:hypothetical protein
MGVATTLQNWTEPDRLDRTGPNARLAASRTIPPAVAVAAALAGKVAWPMGSSLPVTDALDRRRQPLARVDILF